MTEPIRANITIRIHEGELVMSVSDGEEVTLIRQDGAGGEPDAAKGGEVPGCSGPAEGSATGHPDVAGGAGGRHDVPCDGPDDTDGDPSAEQDHGAHPKT